MLKSDRIVSTTCPYCGVGCNLHLHIKDDFIYRVTSPFDAVVNQGNLCVKGRFGYDFIYHPDRITEPLMRRTPQTPGQRTPAFDRDEWRAVSWDEALDHIADRLVEIYRRDGPDALAVYCCAKATNEENYLLQKMFRALFRTNNVDHCTRLCHAGSVAALLKALGTSAMSNTAAEVVQSDCFIVTGSNTTENHPIIALQMKEAVKKHGARLIVIDPRRLELCDYAALWLPLKPGTNVPVFTAMAHVIIQEGLVNQQFVAERTEGYAAFARSVEKFTPDYAEMISGVDRALIVEAARLYATARNGAIYWGMGISQLSHGTASALGLVHLALLTGHIGRAGTGLNPLRGQNNVQGASDAGAMPFHFPGYMEVEQEENAGPVGAGVERRAGRAKPQARADHDRDPVECGTGRRARALHHGREPGDDRAQHECHPPSHGATGVPGRAGCVHQRVGRVCRRDSAGGVVGRKGRHLHQHRPSCAACAPGDLPRGQSRPDWQIICDLAERIEQRQGGAPRRSGSMPCRRRFSARWRAWRRC